MKKNHFNFLAGFLVGLLFVGIVIGTIKYFQFSKEKCVKKQIETMVETTDDKEKEIWEKLKNTRDMKDVIAKLKTIAELNETGVGKDVWTTILKSRLILKRCGIDY